MFNLRNYKSLINTVKRATTNDEKGKSLEGLAKYLFNCIDGIDVQETNVNAPSEEIDLLLWNSKKVIEFNPWDNLIPIECKNWSQPCGANLIDNFASKIRLKHLSTGIFIAANGVTGDFLNGNDADKGAVYRIHEYLVRDGLRIVVLRMEDMEIIRDINELLHLIKDRYCKIYMHKVF